MINFHKFFGREKMALFVYLIVNMLFLLKYAERQEMVSTPILVFAYVLLLVLGVVFFYKLKEWINKTKNFNLIFLITSVVVFIGFIGINLLIDEQTLHVDRWSALDGFIKSILEGNYPYDVQDHLGQTSSNLPGLFYIGHPFYLLSDVGLLQAFVFGLIAYTLYKSSFTNFSKTMDLFLLLMSPAYLWEVFVKSDLMSNLFLVLLFIMFWSKKYQQNLFKKPFTLSFFCSFFMLTRGVVLIPLILFLFDGFIKSRSIVKMKFIGGLLFFSVLISLPVLISIPSIDFVLEHNPFNHQAKYAPFLLIVLSLLIPFVISRYQKDVKAVFYSSFLIITTFLFATFSINIYQEGFTNNVYENLFDLSYLGMIIPFILFYLIHEKNTMHA